MANAFDVLRTLAVRAPHIADMAELLANGKTKPVTPMALVRTAANVARPGAGKHVEKIVTMTGRLIAGQPLDVDFGEDETWSDFATHLQAMESGLIVIFGSRGFGKTQLGLKLTHTCHQTHGYRAESINLHKDDRQDWLTPITGQRLIARIVKVMSWLGQGVIEDQTDDGLTEDDLAARSKKPRATPRVISDREIEQLKRRAILIDEGKVFFSALTSLGQQTSREGMRNLANQLRHLDTVLVVMCQKISELPDFLQDDAVHFYKYANEEVTKKDYKSGSKRDNRERWTEVLTALHAVQYGAYPELLPKWYDEKAREALREAKRAHAHWQEPFNDIRAWSYVYSSTLGGHGYRGVVPNSMVEVNPPDVFDADSWRHLDANE